MANAQFRAEHGASDYDDYDELERYRRYNRNYHDPHDRYEEPDYVPVADTVAAFDLDGTLTRGGSVWQFLAAVCGRRAVASAAVALGPQLVKAALVGGSAADEAKEALFVRTLVGRDAEDVARLAEAFGRAHFRRRARTEVRARLDWHRRQGHLLVLVSASPEFYVRAVGSELGVDGVVATRLEVDDDGRLTGHYAGRNCRGEEKLERLVQWLESSVVEPGTNEGAHTAGSARGPARGPVTTGTAGTFDRDRPFLWAYGNSAGDRQMLAAADIGVDTGRLGRLGKLRRFRRLGDVLTAW